jgi:hypothetical protein
VEKVNAKKIDLAPLTIIIYFKQKGEEIMREDFYVIILDADDDPGSDQWTYVAEASTLADIKQITSYKGDRTSVSKNQFRGEFIQNTTVTHVNSASAKIYKLTEV